jgi:hypothetical protein
MREMMISTIFLGCCAILVAHFAGMGYASYYKNEEKIRGVIVKAISNSLISIVFMAFAFDSLIP